MMTWNITINAECETAALKAIKVIKERFELASDNGLPLDHVYMDSPTLNFTLNKVES